ncbi:MAG: SH3 domain-containing protein [Clostridiales bacterium]|nr:SH3 domain-containing protein [Clostridiales bacterium]
MRKLKNWEIKLIMLITMVMVAVIISESRGIKSYTITTKAASTSSRFLRRTGKVNATSLNIRKTASTSSTKLATIKKSTLVNVLDKKNVGGKEWYKVSFKVNGKTITGYAYKKYITIEATTVSSTTYTLGKINEKSVPVYKTANTYDTKKGTLSKNQEVILLGTLTVNNVKWTKVKVKIDGTATTGYVKSSKITKLTSTASSTTNKKGVTSSKVTARRIASTLASSKGTLAKNTSLTVKATLTVNGSKWYKCTYKLDGTTTTGYILASKVSFPSDAEFLEMLSEFPTSYQSSLRKIHEEYPNWKFVAVNTGLDWNTVIQEESRVGRNTIQSELPNGGTYGVPFSYLSTESGAYDWSKDKYTLMDGTNWFTADTKVIEYYMDPRNFLTSDKIFQFEAQAYDSTQKSSVVTSILSSTFMKGSYSVVDSATGATIKGAYTDAFMEAGKQSGASPYFLAARAKQELGINGSDSVTGTYPGYEGIYNYYNIGAYDTAGGGAIANGLNYAKTGTSYNRPWTNPYKSILGGAEYIASSYIKKGQNTNYFQKFNVVYSPYYLHQYMTNVQAAASEARSTYNSYNSMGMLKEAMVFYIPVYKNMPSKIPELPASKGNPNSYLKTLAVQNDSSKLALTPSFNYKTTSYTMVVPNTISSVTIDASAISSHASITGNGNYTLESGKTRTISIKCTAGNGTSTTYQVKITRLAK